jgi:hypothetical protein
MRILSDTGQQVSRFRPVYAMCEDGVEPEHLQAVLDSVQAVLRIAGVER